MNFVGPFQPKREFKCTNHVNVHKLYAVLIQYVPQTIHFNFEFFKQLNKLYNELGEQKTSFDYNGKSSFVKWKAQSLCEMIIGQL